MAQMTLTITVRRDVNDQEQAQQLYDLVKQRLEDHPEIKLTGHTSNHFAANR